MSRYGSVVVAVLAAATMPIAAQAAEGRVVHKREIAGSFVAGGGHASGARPTDCFVAPCPSPRPQRVCDDVVYSGSVWEVAKLRVQCGVARALVSKLFRANRGLPGPGLPGWNCHGAKGPKVQGHCEDLSSPKGKVRAIFWWLDEGGEQPPPRPPRDRVRWRTVLFEAKDPDTNEVGGLGPGHMGHPLGEDLGRHVEDVEVLRNGVRQEGRRASRADLPRQRSVSSLGNRQGHLRRQHGLPQQERSARDVASRSLPRLHLRKGHLDRLHRQVQGCGRARRRGAPAAGRQDHADGLSRVHKAQKG